MFCKFLGLVLGHRRQLFLVKLAQLIASPIDPLFVAAVLADNRPTIENTSILRTTSHHLISQTNGAAKAFPSTFNPLSRDTP
jgi:hypothetical protein